MEPLNKRGGQVDKVSGFKVSGFRLCLRLAVCRSRLKINDMTFKRFEEIEAWQLAREMCKIVRELTIKPAFENDWELRKQIRNSSGSVMDCIAEGHERGNNAEFIYFLGIAHGSCGEVRSQGYRALDYGFINDTELKQLHALAIRTSKTISGLIKYLNTSKYKGLRYVKPKLQDPKMPPSSDLHFPSQA